MAQAVTAQINVRLPYDLKATGDEGLRALGVSPSDAVRRLWTRLSAHGEELARTQAFLLGEDQGKGEPAPSFAQSDLARGWRMVDDGIARLGIAASREKVSWSSSDDNDLVAQAMEDRMQNRGLI